MEILMYVAGNFLLGFKMLAEAVWQNPQVLIFGIICFGLNRLRRRA